MLAAMAVYLVACVIMGGWALFALLMVRSYQRETKKLKRSVKALVDQLSDMNNNPSRRLPFDPAAFLIQEEEFF